MCNHNCNQGRNCTCDPRQRQCGAQMTRMERRLSDWGVLDEAHTEHDPSSAEIDGAMTPLGRRLAAALPTIMRVAAAGAIAVVAGCVLSGCGGGGDDDAGAASDKPAYTAEPPRPMLSAPAASSTAAATSRSTDVLYLGDSTFTAVYADEPATPDLSTPPGLSYVNAAVGGTTACDAPVDLIAVQANPIAPGGRWSPYRSDAAVREYDAIKRTALPGALWCAQPALSWGLDLLPDGVHPGRLAKPHIGMAISQCITHSTTST